MSSLDGKTVSSQPLAQLPLTGQEFLYLVQNGQSTKLLMADLLALSSASLIVTDFAATDTIVINHNLGRQVKYQVFEEGGGLYSEVFASDVQTNNQLTITLLQPKTGRVLYI